MRRPGDSSRPSRRERSSTLAVGWSSTSGTWPSERGRRLERTVRNMAERTWQEVGANRAEVTSALEAVAANNAQLVAQENAAFEQRDRALRQTVREEFDMEMQEDIPAHVEARIADVCDFFRGQFNEGARRVEQHAREHCEMFAAALREEAHRELISVEGSSASRQARVQEELVRARHGEEQSAGLWRIEMANARAQAVTEQEAAVARCRSSAAAALELMLKIVANDLRKASSVNAIALQSLILFLRIWEPSCGKSRPWSTPDAGIKLPVQSLPFARFWRRAGSRTHQVVENLWKFLCLLCGLV